MGVITDHGETVLNVWARRVTIWLTRLMHAISGHWLLVVNLLVGGFYLGLPFLAPILMLAGQGKVARIIYTIFRPLCHQLPERSFFLGGPQIVYSLADLQRLLNTDTVPLRYIGGPSIGYKVAICERDVAIYTAMLLAGIAFYWARKNLRPLSLKYFALLALPMAVDGFGQLFGTWSSTWFSRLITGGLFGLACIWLTFPYLEKGMAEIRDGTDVSKLQPEDR